MTKKHFIALADCIRLELPPVINALVGTGTRATQYGPKNIDVAVVDAVAEALADFCAQQNPQFDRARFLAYIAGTAGPSGGKKVA